MPPETHGPACVFWADLTPFALEGAIAHLWYGMDGVRTQPHYDYYENFFMQVNYASSAPRSG